MLASSFRKHLPPISTTMYCELGVDNWPSTETLFLSDAGSSSFLSVQKTAAASGSKAMSNCSGLSCEPIPACQVKKQQECYLNISRVARKACNANKAKEFLRVAYHHVEYDCQMHIIVVDKRINILLL